VGHPNTSKSSSVVVLGAGASRGVSYNPTSPVFSLPRTEGPPPIPSPLDGDFFDLLQRVKPGPHDIPAVRRVIQDVQRLPFEHWQSMERAFYTLQLRAYLGDKLQGRTSGADERVIRNFARCVQVLLRNAHGQRTCLHHQALFQSLHSQDTIISFNYDLVPERAIKSIAESREIPFGDWLYGFGSSKAMHDLPLILKLHGSSNWMVSKSRHGSPISVRTKDWGDLDRSPGYRGHRGLGTQFPIFLPFWDKRIEQEPWLTFWRTAFTRLASADALLVWGYSLPLTDLKARILFDVGVGNTVVKLCVVDPAADSRRRWRELLPKADFIQYGRIEEFLNSPPTWWRK
jgi:hypothetical protein